MWEYNYNYSNELYHYGVKGMRWGHRKAQRYEGKARNARASAKEWDELAARAKSKGKMKKSAAYTQAARNDRADAKRYDEKLKTVQKENKFRDSRRDVSKSRSTGAKLATNILAGPFANKTYNSVIAAGGTKTGARVVTALASAGGPLAHIAVGHVYTKMAGEKKTQKNY